MKIIRVNGAKPLKGSVTVSGSKNAALPIIFSCILTNGVNEVENLPCIGDTDVALKILSDMGASVWRNGRITYIDTRCLSYSKPSPSLVSMIRASTYLIGSCLGRFGICHLQPFGGCSFSERPIDMHLDACKSLGGVIDNEIIKTLGLIGGRIVFDKPSVGATVNAIFLATTALGESEICGIATEPHIDCLIDFLISCGADITRHETGLTIRGRSLHGGRIRIIDDMIEAGSYIAAGLITGGDVKLRNCPSEDMASVFDAFSALCNSSERQMSIVAKPYPGFPTDLQPIFAPLMASFSGGEIIDTVWQGRFGYLSSLASFGVLSDTDGNHARIYKSIIHNGRAVSPDLRGGFACLLSALSAEGESEIYSAEIILRGYEDLVKKLSALGADIAIE